MRVLSSSILVAALMCTSCTHLDAAVVTGQTLNTAGDIFLATADEMLLLAEKGEVTAEQYDEWARFAKKFKAVYMTANELFQIAVITEDAVLEGKALEACATLIPELIKFAQRVGVRVEELKQ